MAFDPRTGITTYDAPDIAADPSMDLAVDAAPSTATSSVAPEGFFRAQTPPRGAGFWEWNPAGGGENLGGLEYRLAPPPPPPPMFTGDPAIDWANQKAYNNYEYGLGSDLEGPSWIQRLSLPEILYGQYSYADPVQSSSFDTLLQNISNAAGVSDYDWLGPKAAAAKEYYDQFNTAYTIGTPWADVIGGITENATDPRIAELWPQIAPQLSEQLAEGHQKYLNYQRERDSASKRAMWTQAAGMLFTAFAPMLAGQVGAGTAAGISAADAAAVGLTASEAAAINAAAAAGGTLGSAMLTGAASGGLQGLLSGGNPVKGALTGALTSGLTNYAAPVLRSAGQGIMEQLGWNPDVQFADIPDLKRSGMLMPAAIPEADPTFGGMLSQAAPGVFAQGSMGTLMPPAVAPSGTGFSTASFESASGEPATVSTLADPEAAATMFGAGFAPEAFTAAAPEAAPQQKEPSAVDQAAKYAKIGANLAKLFGGEGIPEGAPQRQEGQDDAQYAQALATYIQVDAQALAEMGLVPGTPEYYTYLMTQLDKSVADLTGDLDFSVEDLSEQLRAKTTEELQSLRRALYVRGQLDLLMGAGTYTDPFTGTGEEVITNGQQVQPGVAAYHRGLARTAGELAGLTGREKAERVREFLGRDVDLYGAQAERNERAEQEALVSQMLEDLKRRRSGMLGGFW